MNFEQDLRFGQQWEQRLVADLKLPPYTSVEFAPMKRFYDWDVKITSDTTTTYEVKADRRAASTGNLCIEYRCSGRPSGISKTKADVYAYYIIGGETDLYLIPTPVIRDYISSNSCRSVRGGDGGRAEMYIIPLYKFDAYKVEK
jgi:hypothetical protein